MTHYVFKFNNVYLTSHIDMLSSVTGKKSTINLIDELQVNCMDFEIEISKCIVGF